MLQSQMTWKALYFLLVCVNENLKNQLLMDIELKGASTISEKVNQIIKANTNSLTLWKALVNLLIIDSEEKSHKYTSK